LHEAVVASRAFVSRPDVSNVARRLRNVMLRSTASGVKISLYVMRWAGKRVDRRDSTSLSSRRCGIRFAEDPMGSFLH